MSGPGSSGPGRGKYAPLITPSSPGGHGDHRDIVESPAQTRSGSIPHRVVGRSSSRGLADRRRSLSRLGTGNGSVLELHFASVEQKRHRWWREAAITALFIASWFLFATLLSVYNKWMFSPQYLAFPFPLFVTALHMLVQWTLASLVRWIWPATFKPERNPTRGDYVKKAFPTAVTTSLDIGLSNLSLKLITLSFYTMCKSSSLIFVLIFAFILHLEKPSVRLVLVISLIASGVLMMVFTTTTFSLAGLVMVISASFFGGLRWGLTQLLLKKKDMGMNNPAATIFWLAPSMAFTLAVVSMLVEGWINVWKNPFWERIGVAKSLLYLFSPGSIAFAMVMSEYYIITRAGVVPMSIAGIFKEVTTLIISAWIFGDRLTELNLIGVGITIGGIALFTYHKYTAALHSAVPLDAHGNPLEEEDAEEVLAVVLHSDTLNNEEGLRLLEDGGDIELPLDDDLVDDENGTGGYLDDLEHERRILERAAEGGHGDGELGNGHLESLGKGKDAQDERPLFTVGDPEEFEGDTPVVAGGREEGAREAREGIFIRTMRNRIGFMRIMDAVRSSRNWHSSGVGAIRRASTSPSVAFAFDIDGVLTQGSNVLPQAKRVLRMLDGENEWGRKFPFILMTNGGGKPEAERCEELSRRLETKIDTTMFMQSHTIMGSPVLPYLERYADKPIMVLGGIGDTCRRIAHNYGFRNVVIPIDVLAWNKDIWPLYRITEEEERIARRDFDFANTPIHAIAVFHDPRNWAPDVQVCLDILKYGSKTRAAFVEDGTPSALAQTSMPTSSTPEGEEPVELIFCNPDLIWRGTYARPRLGQGGFREAFQGIHKAVQWRRYPAKQLGKPTPETYAHAEDMIIRRIRHLHGELDVIMHEKKSIYMIGDNPQSDIAGANAAGWSSILVHTGVYSPSDGPPAYDPTLQASDVEEAVKVAFAREAIP